LSLSRSCVDRKHVRQTDNDTDRCETDAGENINSSIGAKQTIVKINQHKSIRQIDLYCSTYRTSRWVRPSYFRSCRNRHRATLQKCILDEANHRDTSRTEWGSRLNKSTRELSIIYFTGLNATLRAIFELMKFSPSTIKLTALTSNSWLCRLSCFVTCVKEETSKHTANANELCTRGNTQLYISL